MNYKVNLYGFLPAEHSYIQGCEINQVVQADDAETAVEKAICQQFKTTRYNCIEWVVIDGRNVPHVIELSGGTVALDDETVRLNLPDTLLTLDTDTMSLPELREAVRELRPDEEMRLTGVRPLIVLT